MPKLTSAACVYNMAAHMCLLADCARESCVGQCQAGLTLVEHSGIVISHPKCSLSGAFWAVSVLLIRNSKRRGRLGAGHG